MNAAVAAPATVLIASERRRTRASLRLALEPGARCIEAADADSAVAAAVRERPDVCFLGLDAPSNGMRAVTEIASRVPSAAVILLTKRLDEEEFIAAVRSGAMGYLPDSVDPARLPFVVRGALEGESAVPRRLVSRLLDELRKREPGRTVTLPGKKRVRLTQREWEVVDLFLRDATTDEIARELGVVPVTVRRHLGSVAHKLGVATRADVARLLTGQTTASA